MKRPPDLVKPVSCRKCGKTVYVEKCRVKSSVECIECMNELRKRHGIPLVTPKQLPYQREV